MGAVGNRRGHDRNTGGGQTLAAMGAPPPASEKDHIPNHHCQGQKQKGQAGFDPLGQQQGDRQPAPKIAQRALPRHALVVGEFPDEGKKEDLERRTGTRLTVSAEDFTGGMRAVIRGRNVLIDHSFKTSLANEYDQFIFSGGDDIG